MKIKWVSGPRETAFGELRPDVTYELPEKEAKEFIGNGLAKRAGMSTYPAKSEAIKQVAQESPSAPAEGNK